MKIRAFSIGKERNRGSQYKAQSIVEETNIQTTKVEVNSA